MWKQNAEQREERPSGSTVCTEQRASIILSGQHRGPKMQILDNNQHSAEYFRGESVRAQQLVKTFRSPPNTAKGCKWSAFKTIFCGRSVALENFNRLETQLDPLTWIMISIGHTWKYTGKTFLNTEKIETEKDNLNRKIQLIFESSSLSLLPAIDCEKNKDPQCSPKMDDGQLA